MVEKVPKRVDADSSHDNVLQIPGDTGCEGVVVARADEGRVVYTQAEGAARQQGDLQ